jgi:hypothetical protein
MQNSNAMEIRTCALVLGTFFLLLALCGYVPELVTGPASAFPGPGYGYVLGIFPTNYFHNAIGLLVGIWGLSAYTNLGGAITFNRIFAILYALQAVLGLLPFTNTFFGTMPLFGNNIWLSALTAAIAYYYGFVKAQNISRTTTPSISS